MKNRISIKLLACAVLLAFTVVVINGCNDEEGTPENVSMKQIGNEGGALSASDGNVSLTIPSGAMADGTQVSIQVTETVAPKGIGKVYTLSPEGTQFSKPVALSFQYTDEDVKSIPLSRMAIAFKKEDDTWQIMPTVKVDETSRTITTETNHFSQWSIIDGLPAITSFSPASANDDVNTTISITGKNFSSVASENVVTVNDLPVVVASVSGDQLIVMLPAGSSTGKIKVVVNGNAALSADNFTVVNTTPAITSFTPTTASEGITTTVSITGTNFSTLVAENVVSVNGVQATVVSATATQLVVILPGTITTGPIKVVVNGKITQSAENFTVVASVPTITGFTPTSMEEGITTTVAISGTNFSSTLSENVVSINGLPVMVVSAASTQLMVIIPANASTGPIKVAVKDKIVQSASSFTVVATAPKITDFTPTSMQQGIVTTVAISGINFSATPSENVVSINGLPVTVVSSTSTQLMVIIPSNASTGPIQVAVKNKVVQSASSFTVVPVSPTITSFSPASTPEGTPTNVTINGTNFSMIVSDNVVTLNGMPLTVQVVTVSGTASTMVVLVPANATSGRFQVTVKGIAVTASSDFTVTSTFPSIAGFSPTSGTKGIDTTITITGANFSTVASENHVTINGFPATVLAATSTTLSVIIPGAATTGQIQVTVGDKVVQSAGVFTFN